MAFVKEAGSWRKAEKVSGFNRGLLYAVAHGRKPAPPRLLKALGLPLPKTASAPVCQACGKVHVTKRCTRRPRSAFNGHRRRIAYKPLFALTLALWLRACAREVSAVESSQRRTP